MILPAAAPTIARPDDPVESPPTIPSPSSNVTTTILVVDDDGQVRRFVSEALRSQGYAVTDVATGELGLAALKANRFDILIADYAMPGMNGADLVRQARQVHADLRVLMVSGYADSAALDDVLGDSELLRKPFAIAELTQAVAQTLGRRSLER
jgi:CheY-like chemotaxis protein